MLHTLRFFLPNAVYFIMLPFLVLVLFTFYVQGVLKFKCKTPVPKVNPEIYAYRWKSVTQWAVRIGIFTACRRFKVSGSFYERCLRMQSTNEIIWINKYEALGEWYWQGKAGGMILTGAGRGNDTDRSRSKYPGMCKYQFVYPKTHTPWAGIESVPPWWKTDD